MLTDHGALHHFEFDMIRTQIQLTTSQATSLKQAVAATGLSMAELIRRSVDAYLEQGLREDPAIVRRRARAAAGRFRSQEGDLSSQHDSYFSEEGPPNSSAPSSKTRQTNTPPPKKR